MHFISLALSLSLSLLRIHLWGGGDLSESEKGDGRCCC